jgi:aldehyde:ferredoxin oxidoreductase
MGLLPLNRAAEITEAVTGFHFTQESMSEIGERIVNLERAYLVRHGIARKDDNLPQRFLKEPLPNGNSKGAVFEIEPMLNEYYEQRGWDSNGIPRPQKLREIHLEHVIKDLKRNAVKIKKKNLKN